MKKSSIASERRSGLVEPLESRLTPGAAIVPQVVAIDRVPATPDFTDGSSVTYRVSFDQNVTGVDVSDFEVFATGNAKFDALTFTTTANAKVFNVTVAGLQGNGDIRLDLIDDGTIKFGGVGIDGSFLGQTYHLLQTAPKVSSITADGPSTTADSNVSWTVEFSEAVTGVDATDFALVLTGPTTNPISVTPIVSSNGTRYTVSATGISGTGSIGLNLIDDGSITDADRNPLQTAPLSFAEPVSIAAGFSPTSIVSADLDGDGNADLIVGSNSFSNSGSVTVMLGVGDGTFESPSTSFLGIGVRSVAVGDFDGDGAPDVVVAGFGYASGLLRAQVLLGDNEGGFRSQTTVSFGSGGRAVATGDLDGDGRDDIVLTSYSSGLGQVHVLLGNGDGTFQPEQSFNTGEEPQSVAIGDVNGDGSPDVVTANSSDDTVSVLLGNGAGNLGAQTTFQTGSAPRSVALGDLNGDGHLDLAVANNSAGTVSVLLGNGNGTFEAKTDLDTGTSPGSTTPTSVALSDVNGDGRLDIISAGGAFNPVLTGELEAPAEGASVSVLLNAGNGAFATPVLFGSNAIDLLGLAVGDFDGDGKADVAAANFDSTAVVFLNNGNGAAEGPVYSVVEPSLDLAVTISNGVDSVTTGDQLTYTINYANQGTIGATGVTLGVQVDPNFYFLASDNPGWVNLGGFVTKAITGTLDGGESGTETLILRVNEVLTDFSSSVGVTVTIGAGESSGSDVDNSNNSDTDSDGLEGDFYNGYVVISPGVGKRFAPPIVRVFDRISGEELFTIDAYEPRFRGSIRVALGDFNNDGVDDIVTTTQRGTGRLRVFDGRTGHQFDDGPLSEEIAAFNGRRDRGAFVAVGDVNGFGAPEIVVGSALGGGRVRVFSIDSFRDAAPEEGFSEFEIIADFKPFGNGFRGGVRVAVGDVNGFGESPSAAPENGEFFGLADDIIVGQGFFGGKVRVYDGALISDGVPPSESLIKEFQVGSKRYRGGVSVGVGYVDGDDNIDIIVGRNSGRPSVVEVFSGADLTPIGPAINPFDADPSRPRYNFGVRVATADVNGDGIADIIASVGIKKNSLVKFYDGAALREGNIKLIDERTITAYSQFPNVALWVAGSRDGFLEG